MAKPQSNGSSSSGFEAFFAAIGGQESGGNYNATNSRTGASGKYQIMPANIGPWSQQYLGRRISVAEFRRSPRLQEQLAHAVLHSYYTKYGARGAAAAWYSGRPGKANDYSSIGHGGEPSVGAYVDQVLGRIGNYKPPPNGAPQLQIPAQSISTPTADIQPGELAQSGTARLAAADVSMLGSPNPAGLATSSTPSLTSEQNGAGQASTRANPAAAASVAMANGATRLPGESSSAFRDRIVAMGMKYLGTPYVWGGTNPKGFDCSGLLQYIYGKNGYNLPRISADQARAGTRTDISSLMAGDLVAWDNSGRNSGADHIAIWLGDGKILEAPHAGASVRVRSLGKNESAWGVHLNLPD